MAIVALVWLAALAGSSVPVGIGDLRRAEIPLVGGLAARSVDATTMPNDSGKGKRWATLDDAAGKRWDPCLDPIGKRWA